MSISCLINSPQAGVRYLAMRDLLDLPADDPALSTAREIAYLQGPIGEVLSAMQPEGFWVQPGPGYNPKYTSSVWAVILLAQLGASLKHDPRIAAACAYLLENNLNPDGQFSTTNAPSGTVDCLQGNLCWAMSALGCEDPRLKTAYEWMARSVTGEGVAPAGDRNAALRYYAAKCGPLFACGANNRLPCAWGAAKVLLAFGALPAEQRTPLIQRAIAAGLSFMLEHHPAQAGFPHAAGSRPSSNWWKFGFPVFYVTDLLQVAEAAVLLGAGLDPRMEDILQLIRSKQDDLGWWSLEYDYAGKTYGDYGPKRAANPWVTLRAMRVLKTLTPPAAV